MHVIGEGLTFNDVLIVPVRSQVSSRMNVDISTRITKNITLKIPVVSAPMDMVTESAMSIAIAHNGGLGIIHRFLSIEDQVNEVLKVKRAGAEEVVSVNPVSSNEQISLTKVIGETSEYMTGTKHATDKEGRLLCSAAVGLKDTLERSEALIKAGCDLLCLDIAHAHSDHFISAIRNIKKEFDIDLIAGNIATREAAEDLITAGADCIKVGIGPGSTCITRIVTGCGVPQLTAISWVAEACEGQNVTLIADGGMRNSGDLVKALAAGADAGMYGGLFSGAEEAPSLFAMKDEKKYKICRGMASSGALKKRLELENRPSDELNSMLKETAAEGAVILVPYTGSLAQMLKKLMAGVRSGMSYCGAHNLAELKKNARFVKVTPATNGESVQHNDFFV